MSKQNSVRKSWAAWRGWLNLGIGVKRWMVMLGVGAIIAGLGITAFIVALGQNDLIPDDLYRILTLQFLPVYLRVLVPLILGGALIALAIFRLGSTLIAPFRNPDEGVAFSLQRYSRRKRGPHVVAIGGGTGMPTLLRGLKEHTSNITAIVTVADDGGSSGRLRRELGLIPPGDFRNNLASLARDEALMTQLMQYRFAGRLEKSSNGGSTSELTGHAFGNLLLAALTSVMGSFEEALVAAERVLALRGKVLPSTLANVSLVAEVVSGQGRQRIVGESRIPEARGRIAAVAIEPPNPEAFPPAVKAILNADIVIIGPGSLYTSILPNLLISGIARALQRTRALKIYVCNVATQAGETDNYSVADHVAAINSHMASMDIKQAEWMDLVVANDNRSIPADTGGGNTIYVEPTSLPEVNTITKDLVDEKQPWRHDSRKLAQSIMAILVDRV